MSAKFKIGDFVYTKISKPRERLKVIEVNDYEVKLIRADGYDEKIVFLYKPEEIVLFSKKPKFKVGDKIVNPTSQNGGNLGGSAKTLIEKSNNENLGYLVVTDITYNRYLNDNFDYWLGFSDLPNASVSFNDEDKLELFEETPETKFKVGQVVIVKGRPEKYIIKDISIKQKDGIQIYEGEDTATGTLFPLIENTLELTFDQPKFKIGDKVKIPKTHFGKPIQEFEFPFIENAKRNKQDFLYVIDLTVGKDGELKRVWLSDKEDDDDGLSFKMIDNIELYEETPQPKFKIGDKVKIESGLEKLTVTNSKFDNNKKQWLYDVRRKSGAIYFEITEDRLQFDIEPTPEKDNMIGKVFLKDNSKRYYIKTEKEPYLVPTSKEENEYIEPILANEDVFILNSTAKAEEIGVYFTLELRYKKGIAISYKSRNLTESSGYITDKETFRRTMKLIENDLREGSEKVLANAMLGTNISFMDLVWNTKDIKCEFLDETPDKPEPKFKVGDIVKSIDGKQFRQYEVLKVEFGVDEYVYDVKRVGTEAYVVYTESELELISRATTDCEADPSLIVSEQVKKFYDLNKTRIEKLNANISCKIIKALVSLSDYEKCGTPSKIKLPTKQENLLSEIQNLKF